MLFRNLFFITIKDKKYVIVRIIGGNILICTKMKLTVELSGSRKSLIFGIFLHNLPKK